eukprot:366228-Chlamydomonas_euryale.AAC.30
MTLSFTCMHAHCWGMHGACACACRCTANNAKKIYLLLGLCTLLPCKLSDMLLCKLLQLTFLGLALPFPQLLLCTLVPDAPPLQVAACIEVCGQLSVTTLASQQRSKSALPAAQAEHQVQRVARLHAVVSHQPTAIIQLAPREHQSLAGARDALLVLRNISKAAYREACVSWRAMHAVRRWMFVPFN